MPDGFWKLYNHLAMQWYSLEYGKVRFEDRFYQRQMDLMSLYMAHEATVSLGREEAA